MKHYILSGMMFIPLASFLQTTLIPDVNFEQKLIDLGYDTGSPDGMVTTAVISSVFVLDCSGANISSLTGIEDFTILEELHCANNQLTELDLLQNINLHLLNCSNNQLTSLILPQNAVLAQVDCFSNQLSALDVTQNPGLSLLNCRNNQLLNLNVTMNPLLVSLSCYNNLLTNLDLSQNPDLAYLYCNNNMLSWLDLSQNLSLNVLHCYFNQLSGLNVSQNNALTSLACHDNQLTCLNLKNGNNTSISSFLATGNPGLMCIAVDDPAYSTSNWTSIDSQTSFNTNCSSNCFLGISEPELSIKKEIGRYDLLGRKINDASTGIAIKIYDDGSTEKEFPD